MNASTTTTTVTTSSTMTNTPCFDPSYLKTTPGMFKMFGMLLDVFGTICVVLATAPIKNPLSFYSFVSITSFWMTALIVCFYLFHLIERTSFLPWMVMEMTYSAVWTFLYLAAAALIAGWGYIPLLGAATFIGFMAMAVYGYQTYLKVCDWRKRQSARREMNMSRSMNSHEQTEV